MLNLPMSPDEIAIVSKYIFPSVPSSASHKSKVAAHRSSSKLD
jgi:hypothetical protein